MCDLFLLPVNFEDVKATSSSLRRKPESSNDLVFLDSDARRNDGGESCTLGIDLPLFVRHVLLRFTQSRESTNPPPGFFKSNPYQRSCSIMPPHYSQAYPSLSPLVQPLVEANYRRLMVYYLDLGQPDQALNIYHQCYRVLHKGFHFAF